jgi:hypothetical protein
VTVREGEGHTDFCLGSLFCLRESVRCEDAPGPFRVLPAAVRVPAKVATRAPPGKKRHVFAGNRKREARAECGKQHWCPSTMVSLGQRLLRISSRRTTSRDRFTSMARIWIDCSGSPILTPCLRNSLARRSSSKAPNLTTFGASAFIRQPLAPKHITQPGNIKPSPLSCPLDSSAWTPTLSGFARNYRALSQLRCDLNTMQM